MKIESAQYIVDEENNNQAVHIVHDGGQVCSCPVDGSTWINGELEAWVTGGGQIAAAAPVPQE